MSILNVDMYNWEGRMCRHIVIMTVIILILFMSSLCQPPTLTWKLEMLGNFLKSNSYLVTFLCFVFVEFYPWLEELPETEEQSSHVRYYHFTLLTFLGKAVAGKTCPSSWLMLKLFVSITRAWGPGLETSSRMSPLPKSVSVRLSWAEERRGQRQTNYYYYRSVQGGGVRVLPDEDVVEGEQDGAQRHGEHVEDHREDSTGGNI